MSENFIAPKVTVVDGSGNTGISIKTQDSYNIDSFGRFRVSNPTTIFDSKNLFKDNGLTGNTENLPLFYDNQEISGSGTTTQYNINRAEQELLVSNLTAGNRVRQTKMRFNYQPGKSQLILLTFNLKGAQAGIIKREGYFDDNNGLFLEASGSTYNLVKRSYATNAVVEDRVPQSEWNIDKFDGNGPSGIVIDFTKTQILYTDIEWLGVGRVRMGFVIGGIIYYAHQFLNSNVNDGVYMSTPNLPLRSQIINDGTGGATSMVHICASVMSEGGEQDNGVIRYASTNGASITAGTAGTDYAIIGIRLKSDYIGASIKLLTTALQVQTATSKCEWSLILNPTVSGTFTYNDQPQSAVQIATGISGNTVTGGYKIIGGFIETGGPQTGSSSSLSTGIDNAILLGSLIDGTVDEMVLVIKPIGGSSNVNVEGSITWREIS